MSSLFPHANVVAAILVLVVGFGFHWVGQLISVLSWDLATRLGLQEKHLLTEHKVYEHAIAVADVSIGWLYAVAAVGLLLDRDWGYKLAWIPGSIMIYHAVSAWVWESNRRATGHRIWSDRFRVTWCSVNAATGLLTLLVAWTGS